MSQFANAMESADTENTAAPTEAIPEDETATAAVADTEAEASDVAQEDADTDQLGEEQEQLGEVEETIEQESAGLSPEAARYLNLSLQRIVGKKHANKIIATENYSSGRAAQEEAKRIALEGIKDTLKSFWEAIKAQLKKFYAKVKSFFIKMFSGAKKLVERAKKLQEKANSTVGTIEEKSFSFGQTKAIAVEGKYGDTSALLSGLNNIRKWIEGNITVKKSDDYETAIEQTSTKMETAIKGLVNRIKRGTDTSTRANVSAIDISNELDKVGAIKIAPLGSLKSPESKLIEMYAGGKDSKDDVKLSESLPGGKSIVHITANIKNHTAAPELEDVIKMVKNSRLMLGNDKYTPREVSEGDVKTLTTSQIDKVCDEVIEIAETSYTYEKAWERRDKFQAKLEREIDSIVKEVDGEDHDNIDSRVQRVVRQYAESFTASVRRRTSFESQFISYALTTSNAFLNYSERSLAQHKSK